MLNEAGVALRGLARSPGFTLLAILTLALGIGGNAALFTVVDSVLLRPLPYRDAERLVVVSHPLTTQGGVEWNLSPHGFFYIQDQNVVFEDIGVYMTGSANLAAEGAPDRARIAAVSASLLRTLEARATAGRLFEDADNEPGAPAVAVLGHGFWQRRYGGRADVVGTSIRVNGEDVTVVGVLEAGLTLPGETIDVWRPMVLDRSSRPVNSHYLSSIARLKPGTALEAAQQNVTALAGRFVEVLPTAYDETFIREYGFTTRVRPLREKVVGNAATMLWVVFGGVGIVLLVGCANVANLFLVRAEGRVREVAVRSALGATRGRLARHFITESLLVSLAAGALALLLAQTGVRALLALAPSNLPRLSEVALRGSTVVFALTLSVIAGIVFGLFPVARWTEAKRSDALRDGGVRTTASRSRHRVRGSLVVAQVALALVLLAGAGLMLRSFQALRGVEPGYDPAGTLTFDVALPAVNYGTHADASRFWERLLVEVRTLPGVTRAGVISALPLKSAAPCSLFFARDRPLSQREMAPCYETLFVTPELFETLALQVAGRTFRPADVDPPTHVAILSRTLAERTWPGESAIGRAISTWGIVDHEVIGVAEDVRLRRLDEPPTPLVYLPMIPPAEGGQWNPVRSATVVVRTTRVDPTSLTAELRLAVSRVDPEIPIANVETLDEVVAASLSRVSFLTVLLGIAATVALLLGTIGLYGVVAYVVNERRSEIGIRMALGARVGGIVRMFVRQALALTVLGVGLGLVGALGAGRVLRSQLFGVAAGDPITLVLVAAILLGIASIAAWLPARRASRIDPVDTMRV